jgi:hypothetical protein
MLMVLSSPWSSVPFCGLLDLVLMGGVWVWARPGQDDLQVWVLDVVCVCWWCFELGAGAPSIPRGSVLLLVLDGPWLKPRNGSDNTFGVVPLLKASP